MQGEVFARLGPVESTFLAYSCRALYSNPKCKRTQTSSLFLVAGTRGEVAQFEVLLDHFTPTCWATMDIAQQSEFVKRFKLGKAVAREGHASILKLLEDRGMLHRRRSLEIDSILKAAARGRHEQARPLFTVLS